MRVRVRVESSSGEGPRRVKRSRGGAGPRGACERVFVPWLKFRHSFGVETFCDLLENVHRATPCASIQDGLQFGC